MFVELYDATASYDDAGWEKRLMRRVAILAIVIGCDASAALAAPPATQLPSAQALAEAAFTSNASRALNDPIGRLLDRDSYAPGAGFYRWRADEVALPGSPTDSLRIRESSLTGGPGELPYSRR